LQSAIADEIQALLETALIGIENPLPVVIAVKIKPRDAIRSVPLDMRVIRGHILFHILLADVFRCRVRLFLFARIARKPVVALEGNSQR
jgi:hypothetical protein